MNESDSSVAAPLDTRQLNAFVQVAGTGSFTVAARRLHLSQSAVSHSIKGLEEAVGCSLFDRVGKWGKGRLRIGASPTACQYILPPVLREFKEPYPDYQIAIQPADTDVVLEELRERRLDVALTLEPRRPTEFEVHKLFEDELKFILSPSHPWARANKAPREEVSRQNYILYHRTSHTFQLVDEYFAAERITLNTVMELGSMEAIKELVKLGIGVSILAPWIAQDELRSGALVSLPLGRRKLLRRWTVSLVKGRTPSLAEETFIGLCRSVTENMTVSVAGLPAATVDRSIT